MNYVEKDGNIFIPINNRRNCICYHVALVQLFHTSNTFNKLMNEIDLNKFDDIYRLLLQPFQVYAKVNVNNINESYFKMKKSYEELSTILHPRTLNGYSSHLLEYFYILPVINKLFPNEMSNICSEINADPIHFNTPMVKIQNINQSCPFLIEKYFGLFVSLCEEMCQRYLNNGFKISPTKFNGGIIEVFPNYNSVDGGHAIFILKDGMKYYIFDDDTTIDLFERYVNNRDNNIHKIAIYTNDPITISEIQSLWKEDILTRRVNNRYEIINTSQTISPEISTISKSFINLHQNENLEIFDDINRMELKGGEDVVATTKPEKNYQKLFKITLICCIILAVILVVDIIFGVTVRFKCGREKYKCPCMKK